MTAGGASGAWFQVQKRGDDPRVVRRLRAQYEWLAARDYPSLVRVHYWVEDSNGAGYAMELLEPLPWPRELSADRAALAVQVIRALGPVWAEPPLTDVPWTPDGRLDAFPRALRDWVPVDALRAAPATGTHGDPTLENAMCRPGTPGVVLVDPVPDIVLDGKVPAIRALDLGKILQSGLGYEDVRRRLASRWALDEGVFDAVRLRCASEAEWVAACWCAALHVAKFLPYQPHEMQLQWRYWFPGIVNALRWASEHTWQRTR